MCLKILESTGRSQFFDLFYGGLISSQFGGLCLDRLEQAAFLGGSGKAETLIFKKVTGQLLAPLTTSF